MARSGIRSWVRAQAACEPDGCGAQPGQPCIAYVPKHGKTTGKPTADVHAARWRAFRAQQRRKMAERAEEKDMTEISDEEAREALWASSEAGRAAVDAAWTAAGDRGLLHDDFPVDMADIAAVAYAAHRAHEAVADLEAREEQEPEHVHAGPISAVSHGTGTDGTPWTFALRRCRECGGSFTQRLEGSWTWAELERQP